jgi:MFS family permease
VFSPFVVIMLVLSRWAGRLVERYGARLPLTIGPLITTVGYAVFALAPQDGYYWRSFFPAVLVTSIGMTITATPHTTTVMNAVTESHAGVASGINNAVSRLASLVAFAAFGALLVMIFTYTLDHPLIQLSLNSGEAAQIHASRLQLATIKRRIQKQPAPLLNRLSRPIEWFYGLQLARYSPELLPVGLSSSSPRARKNEHIEAQDHRGFRFVRSGDPRRPPRA